MHRRRRTISSNALGGERTIVPRHVVGADAFPNPDTERPRRGQLATELLSLENVCFGSEADIPQTLCAMRRIMVRSVVRSRLRRLGGSGTQAA